MYLCLSNVTFMRMRAITLLGLVAFFGFISCTHQTNHPSMQTETILSDAQVAELIAQMKDSLGNESVFRIERGVKQVAALWRASDGSASDFSTFCKTHFVADTAALHTLFGQLERNFETLYGYFHNIDRLLKEPLQLDGPAPAPVDRMFGGYDVSAHFTDDMYTTRIGFLTALNFPFFTLEEKTARGPSWSRRQWAYARMGDMFVSRVPAGVQQLVSKTLTDADAYISDYNIYMGSLRDDHGKALFPDSMKLITHWGLRDELKSDYADTVNGLQKQRMIYKVMQRIIDQTIPQQVINTGVYTWNPYANKIYRDGKEMVSRPEPDKRYAVFLSNFHAMLRLDAYSPHYPTALLRAFDGTMEIRQHDVEGLFHRFLSSPQIKKVAALIAADLGRELEPFDIWYNGFKSRGGMPEEELTAITSRKYPDARAVEAALPDILMQLGWQPENARRIASMVTVDASRGAGHAMGAAMRNDQAHLRTRISGEGMDYKGYNIAVHEFGHNVEQTITMNDVDFYMLNGVPNTAFTEAVAFLFQKKDVELLGLKKPAVDDIHYNALDVFWSCYEIMGVSLVDIGVWEWLYAHPEATPGELKKAVMDSARSVWNTYYAGILGGKDETLLGVYSHMIDYPLYLPNYPMGHLIDFQIEKQMEGKNIADEMQRIYTQGRLIPQLWMENAVGSKIAIDPLLTATSEALNALKR